MPFTKKRLGLLLGGLYTSLCGAPAVLRSAEWAGPYGCEGCTRGAENQPAQNVTPPGGAESVPEDESGPAVEQRPPRPVTPPRKPVQRRFRFVLVGGMNILAWARYSYDTQVSLPGGQPLHYFGTRGSPGVTVFGGGAITFPGALRRVTLGANINTGGLDSVRQPVIPDRVSTPFSETNLRYQILENQYRNSQGWRSLLSPYIEHEFHIYSDNRIRVGYQYWGQPGSYKGSFAPSEGGPASADYNVRLKYCSHLLRFSLNNFVDLTDPDESHASRRKSGLIRQVGVLAGTHRTIMVFIGIGAFWSF